VEPIITYEDFQIAGQRIEGRAKFSDRNKKNRLPSLRLTILRGM